MPLKTKIIIITIHLSLFLLAACGEQSASLVLKIDGQEIYRCDQAVISELSPKPGGWRFACSNGGGVYFTYETDGTQAKGTIERIHVTKNPNENEITLLPAYRIADTANLECEKAKSLAKNVGPDPFPTTLFGRLDSGTFKMDLAQPCGILEVTIDQAKK